MSLPALDRRWTVPIAALALGAGLGLAGNVSSATQETAEPGSPGQTVAVWLQRDDVPPGAGAGGAGAGAGGGGAGGGGADSGGHPVVESTLVVANASSAPVEVLSPRLRPSGAVLVQGDATRLAPNQVTRIAVRLISLCGGPPRPDDIVVPVRSEDGTTSDLVPQRQGSGLSRENVPARGCPSGRLLPEQLDALAAYATADGAVVVTLVNPSTAEVDVLELVAPGLTAQVEPALPFTLAPGSTRLLVLDLAVTDCVVAAAGAIHLRTRSQEAPDVVVRSAPWDVDPFTAAVADRLPESCPRGTVR